MFFVCFLKYDQAIGVYKKCYRDFCCSAIEKKAISESERSGVVEIVGI